MPQSSLNLFEKLLFNNTGQKISFLEYDKESADYEACSFQINSLKIIYRQAKITPKKAGQFVTLWQRNKENNKTSPFSIDEIDYCVVAPSGMNIHGYYVFPSLTLLAREILTNNKNIKGKTAFRVYPPSNITFNPHDDATNNEAKKTQNWQAKHFYSLNNITTILDRFIQNCS